MVERRRNAWFAARAVQPGLGVAERVEPGDGIASQVLVRVLGDHQDDLQSSRTRQSVVIGKPVIGLSPIGANALQHCAATILRFRNRRCTLSLRRIQTPSNR